MWNKCVLCRQEIYSKTYKPLQLTLDGVEQNSGSQVVLYGYAHKVCQDNLLRKLGEMLSKNIEFEQCAGEKQ
jgi:hypothetical protein